MVVASCSLGMAVFIMSANDAPTSTVGAAGCDRCFVVHAGIYRLRVGALIAVLTTAREPLQGLSAAAVSVTSLALISAAFPEAKEKARAIPGSGPPSRASVRRRARH